MLTRLFLARAVIQVGKQKWGEERGGQLYSNFFEIPSSKREGQNINSTLIIQKLYYSVLTRIATALELDKVLMYVCSIIIVDTLPLSLCC
jgi:hypothetical protein